MDPELRDDEIADRLRRKAESARLPAEWARRELLPAVNAGIDRRVADARPTRLAALAGLAAVATFLLLLVVALPRLSPGTSVGETPTSAPSASAVGSTEPSSRPQPTGSTGPIVAPATPAATPSTAGMPPAEIACARGASDPEFYSSLEMTVHDQTGLVSACTAFPGRPADISGDDVLADQPYVRNPAGDESTLEVMFSGTPCDTRAEVTLVRTADAYSVHVELPDVYDGCRTQIAYHWVSLDLRDAVRADQVAGSLTSAYLPASTLSPDDSEAGPATWQLAPGERPTANSRSVEVLIFEEECAGGQSPEGRVLGPAIEYRSATVVVSFAVRRLPGDCPTAPGAPFTVRLAEPLGERSLVDAGGSGGPVERVTFEADLLVQTAPFPGDLAVSRIAGFLGPDVCTRTVHHDREVGREHFDEWAAEVAGGEGFALGGRAWLGDWRDAARAFDAFEVYATPDREEHWIMAVAAGQDWLGGGEDGWLAAEFPLGAIVVADLYRADVTGGRTLWLPASTGHTAGTANCTSGPGNWPDPAPGPGARTELISGNFRLAISSDSVLYEPNQPIDVEGALTYTGQSEALTVHAGGGLLQFGFQQLDGDLEMDPAAVAMGMDFELARGRAFVRQYSKSGGWSNDDANAEFYAQFLDDPEFRLPPGVWRIYVLAEFSAEPDFFAGGQGVEVTLKSSIVIDTR